MSDAISAPDRSPSVRVKYSGRRKKRRESMSKGDQDQSGSDHDLGAESSGESVHESVASPAPSHSSFSVPPPPRPRAVGTPARPPASSSRSSVTPSISRFKPVSTSSATSQSPHGSVADDGASEKGSKPRLRKREEDRIKFFKDDPNCGELEPYRAFCIRCQAWVQLNPNRRYVMKLWIAHRKSECKLPGEGTAGSNEAPKQAEQGEDIKVNAPPAPSAVPETETKEGKRARACAEREAECKAKLEADPLVAELRAHELLCKLCEQWIPLGMDHATSWNNHREYCPAKQQTAAGSSAPVKFPTKPVDAMKEEEEESDSENLEEVKPSALEKETPTEIEKKLRNDPQWKSLGTVGNSWQIECRYCTTIHTDEDIRSIYAWWEQHKKDCAPPPRQTRLSSFTFWLPKFSSIAEQGSPSAPAKAPAAGDMDIDIHVPHETSSFFASQAEMEDPNLRGLWEKLKDDTQLWSFSRTNAVCRFCGVNVVDAGDVDLDAKWQEHKETCSQMKPDSPYFSENNQEESLTGWLAKLWPYGRNPQPQMTNGQPSSHQATPSRKRAREEDEEGNARHTGRAVRPRYEARGGLWRRLSASVVGLVDGVRAGYAAASMEGAGRPG